jgi:exo-beta-1,3-glucanase (GH17 family)
MSMKITLVVVVAICLLGAFTAVAQDTPEPRIGINYSLSLPSSPALLPSDQQIVSDMRMIGRKVSTIRLYNVPDIGSTVVPLAERENIQVVLQAWLTDDSAANDTELAAAIDIANANQNVIGIIVGEEVISRGVLEPDALIEHLTQVRDAVPRRVAVGYADQLNEWLAHPELAEAVDWVGLDSLGFASCQSVEEATRYTINQWAILIGTPAYADKHVVITETGWPTDGTRSDCAEPVSGSPETQNEFMQAMLELATAAHLDVFLTSFSDEPWRCATEPNARYECHWGLVENDRTPKLAWDELPVMVTADRRRLVAVVNTEADTANCRSEASSESSVLLSLTDGIPVQIVDWDSDEEWILVQRLGEQCWMHHSLLTVDGRRVRVRSERMLVSTDNLDDYLASVDLSQCPGEDFSTIVRTTYTAPDVLVFAACIAKLNNWLGDADTQQLNEIAAGTCGTQPSAATQASIDNRFRTAWALDSIASAYYNFGLSLRNAGLVRLAEEAFEMVTEDLSCAWAYGEDEVNGSYFFSVPTLAQRQLNTLPLVTPPRSSTTG